MMRAQAAHSLRLIGIMAPAAWLGGLLIAVAGVWVFRGALSYFFSADDFPAVASVRFVTTYRSMPEPCR
jgi:hypothetical protein